MTDLIAVDAEQDTPRSAYGVLERRATITTLALLAGSAGLSWWYTVGRSHDMGSMVQGFAHVGTAMPFDMSVGLFIAMWLSMMVAMMFPTVAPIVLLHRMVLRRRGEGPATTAVFAVGYLAIWTAVGFVPLAVLVGFRHVSAGSSWVERTAGAVLVLAGVYQFTRWKDACQRACRTPLTFLVTHDFGGGAFGALRVGASHGLYCLGCCWALMAVLFVVGLMNLAWMAGIAAVFLAEKNWRHGVGLSKVVGSVVIGLGIAILVHPSLLDSIVPAGYGPGLMAGH
jgi:predicted metal-binding membrane protein